MVAVRGSNVNAGVIIKLGVSALIGYTFYDQLKDQVVDLKKVSYYNETNCQAVKVSDLNNIPSDVKPMAYEGLMFLYDLIPLGLGLLFLYILNETIKSTRGVNEAVINAIANEILAFSITSLIGVGLFIGITPSLAETTCKVETSTNKGMFDNISILLLKFWPLVVGGVIGFLQFFCFWL